MSIGYDYTDDVMKTITRILEKWSSDEGATTKELKLLEKALEIQLDDVREAIRLREESEIADEWR
jgi:hypothetical protein